MTDSTPTRLRPRESGFALILALLTLLLLTTMGLALASSTSTELQISTNHRWSEQARYNAEAGIEVAKRVLAQVPDWNTILPLPRPATTTWDPNATTVDFDTPAVTPRFSVDDPNGLPSRNFEGFQCDSLGGGEGYGAVLHTGSGTPYQFVSNVEGFALNGSFTLWIRRPTDLVLGSPQARDYQGSDALVLVSEGVAPYTGPAMNTAVARQFAARATIEVVLRRTGGGSTGTTTTDCGARQGQAGGGAQNTGFGGCVDLGVGANLVSAIPGATDVGTGNVK
jgi:hypothetical protein